MVVAAVRVPSMWIDTCVEVEIDTFGDIYAELDRVEIGSLLGTPERIEYRRLRAQGSWWMGMALCKQHATTIVAMHEVKNLMVEKLAPPGTDLGALAAAIVWVLGEHGIFEGWTRQGDLDGEKLSDRSMDRLIVEKARDHALTLVTRDGGMITKTGPKKGVTPIEPEDYARVVLSREDAREMFLGRLDGALLAYAATVPGAPRRMEGLWNLRRQYQWVWAPPGDVGIVESTGSTGIYKNGLSLRR